MAEKETVLIIHGTFAAPVAGKFAWYEPGSAFCRGLDERLAAKGSSARCWAHLDECGDDLRRRAGRSTTYFSWSGRNSWLDRTAAAQQLLAELNFLAERGWKWKVVAHSHGGNVALEAFDLENLDRPGGLTGNTVLLGTPIFSYSARRARWLDIVDRIRVATTPAYALDLRRPIAGREASLLRVIAGAVVSLVVWAAVIAWFLRLAGLRAGELVVRSPWWWVVRSGSVIVLAALYWWLRHGAQEAWTIMSGFEALRNALFMMYPPRVLFINSERDEAYGFLSGMLSAAAPWDEDHLPGVRKRPAASPVAFLKKLLAQALQADTQRYPWAGRDAGRWWSCIALIVIILVPFAHGLHILRFLPFLLSWSLIIGLLSIITFPAPLFFAVSVPWRVGEAALFTVSDSVHRAAARFGRRNAWKTLQELALGLSGSPHRLSDVSISICPHPKWARGEFLFEALAKTAEDAAVAARTQTVDRELGRVKERSDAEFWRIDRWRDRIGAMAADAELVHTIYYRHPDCLEQIATHLGRSMDELFAEQKRAAQVHGAAAAGATQSTFPQ